MPNAKLNHEAVVCMALTGFHPECIAERLGCSRRQVDRILKANEVTTKPFLFDFGDEHLLWSHYKDWGDSAAKIALRFGVTRQAVHAHFYKLSQLKEQPLRPIHGGILHTTHSIERVQDAEFEILHH